MWFFSRVLVSCLRALCVALFVPATVLLFAGCPPGDDDDTTTSPTAPPINNETPTPAAPSPTPAEATPTPMAVTPTQGWATPTPAIVSPTPFWATPSPAAPSPTPTGATPTPAAERDQDGDGYTIAAGDCDDTDLAVNPGAEEVCNGVDDDCDTLVDEDLPLDDVYVDADLDGFGDGEAIAACGPLEGTSSLAGDCNDGDPEVFPGALELCDGIDNDCNGIADDSKPVWYPDQDGDGYGTGGDSLEACDPGPGFATTDDDCDDTDPAVNPGAGEVCNGIDDDCDGEIDEDLPLETLYVDADLDGYGSATTLEACGVTAGVSGDGSDCDDTDPSIFVGAQEICDTKDNDCDGEIDEEGTTTYFIDADGDGHGDPGSPIEACDATGLSILDDDCDDADASTYPGAEEICDSKDNTCEGDIDEGVRTTFYLDSDGDGFGDPASPAEACDTPEGHVANAADCNDTDPMVNPAADERCNDADDNCNGTIDEGALKNYYADADGDGFGTGDDTVESCDPLEGYVLQPGDCDDGNDITYPGAIEICDDLDNDCDGTTDEEVLSTFYADGDGDDWGLEAPTIQGCTAPDGYGAHTGDCDDNDPSIYPDAPETCDGKDNNCDGAVDESGETPFYLDGDGDGYGRSNDALMGCEQPEGYTTNGDDCNDTDAAIHPDAEEVCNDQDDNCDGQVDEGVLTTYYLDADGDGYGREAGSTTGCAPPSSLFVTTGGDCDDLEPSVHPDADESCNGVDDDCDASVDEAVKTTYYQDADSDGYGDATVTTEACAAPDGYVADHTDCDDMEPAVHPDAEELCDGLDNDCDGTADEGAKSTFYLDNDGDGYGQTYATIQGCTLPAGYALEPDDCNDADTTTYPGADELCDSRDNDCDTTIDEGAKTAYYYDADQDGYGGDDTPLEACSPPSDRWVSNNEDCNDLEFEVHPGQPEICNDFDDNCDGVVDDVDDDNDGFQPTGCGGLDCDDSNAEINPFGQEICDGADNDCDGRVDESDQAIDFDNDPENCGGCFVVCGEGGEGPTCLNGSCGSMPVYQHRWKGTATVATDQGWTDIVGSEFVVITKGDPLEIEMSIPLVGGSHSACRPTIDGAWAGSFEGYSEDYIWIEGLDYTGYNNGSQPRMWTRTRIYYDIPEGPHTVAVQCITDAGSLTVGRGTSSAIVITREYHEPDRVAQTVSLQGSSIGVTSGMVKVPGTDLVMDTTGETLEITISLPIGTGGHAGCLEWMDGAPIPSNPGYGNTFWYAGLESTYNGWIMWHHTRTYQDIPAGTHTFSIRCYNDSGTLNIGVTDGASVIIARELDETLYQSAQSLDAYGNGWEIADGVDSRWYDLANFRTQADVTTGSLEIYLHTDTHDVPTGYWLTCRPTIDGLWAGSYAGLPFTSNDEEGAFNKISTGTGHHGMWHRSRVYTGIPVGTHTIGMQCLSSGNGFDVGNYAVGNLLAREVDLIADTTSP